MRLLSALDRYIEQLCVPANPVFTRAIRDAKTHGLPAINVSPNEGKLLYLLAKIAGARRILEVGTLGGYSTLWLASALPARGKLITLELEPRHAEVARKNLARAGLLKKVEIRVGDARQSLRQLKPAFDVVFIDADKESYPAYLDFALKLTRPGSLILVDNVIRHGRVLHTQPTDAGTRAIRKVNRQLATDPRLETILVPLMRERIDGLAIALRR
jgi:predicted O-methyltransferase YrrM